jgi:hypothetical protein
VGLGLLEDYRYVVWCIEVLVVVRRGDDSRRRESSM